MHFHQGRDRVREDFLKLMYNSALGIDNGESSHAHTGKAFADPGRRTASSANRSASLTLSQDLRRWPCRRLQWECSTLKLNSPVYGWQAVLDL